MTENRWQAHRAGILNYWYYDEAEFYFSGGRLLLRGSNGSGKSVTMQSLVTVLLDGVKRADRLDSFGSKSRTMDDYLLGEKEISDYGERTGYLYLEYKREDSDQYVTTGIGLHARRGTSKVDFWGFLLQNGRRIGKDFFLYKLTKNPETNAQQKVPLTRRELENAIGQDGRVTTEQREYMAMVNQYVFGFEDIGKYEELMKLLIQLRSPKLSRDFKPSVIYEILNASLPTLSDDDLRPLAETLENMEKTRLVIEQLKREQGAFERICRAYTAYNEGVLAERALAAAECKNALDKLARKEAEQKERQTSALHTIEAARSRQQELTVEAAGLRQEQENLKEHEAYKAAAKRQEALDLLEKERADYNRKEELLREKRRRELSLQEKQSTEKQRLSGIEAEASSLLSELEELAKQAGFSEHAALQHGFSLSDENAEEYFRLWREKRQTHGKHLQALQKSCGHYEQETQKAQQLEQELGEESRLLDRCRYEHGRLLELLEQEREALVKSFYEWKAGWDDLLPFGQEQEIRLVSSLRGLYEENDWHDVRDEIDGLTSAHQRELDSAIGAIRAKVRELSGKIKTVEEELCALTETREAEPELPSAYQEAMQGLESKGIPFLPFYEATEFKPQVTPERRERLESALLDAGVLNALILESNEASTNLPEEMRGTVLFSSEPAMLSESLLDYLEPVPGDSGILRERIEEILLGIAVNDSLYPATGGISVNIAKGAYCLGNTAGRAAERESALFIGRQAREDFRRRQIAAKEAELAALKEAADAAKSEEERLLEESDQLHLARRKFPSGENVREAYEEARAKANDIDRQQIRLQEKDEKKKKLTLALRVERAQILEQRGETTIPFSAAAYEEALLALDEYSENWNSLTILQTKYLHAAELFRQYEQEIEYAAREADDLKGELVDKEMSMARLDKTIEALTRQLAEMDASAIERRIAEITSLLGRLPEEMQRTAKELGQAEREKEFLDGELERSSRRKAVFLELHKKWQELLAAEQERGFTGREKTPLREITQAWRRKKEKENVTLRTLAQGVEKQYALHRDEIAEYRFTLMESVDDIGVPPEIHPDDEELFLPRWQTLQDYASRQLAITETGGQPLSPYEQAESLKNHLAEQESLLSEQDKKIYQEIILNSIGRTISDKIYSAEDWIKKMNQLMAKSETSSALRFRLEWRPITGSNDNELDTAELVELLHGDPELMKDEDMKKLELHFSSRIKRAREEAESLEKDAEAFQATVRNQLDYRQWFQFRLFYDKGEQIQRRELTDKAFFRFSGGEKAMAMYVPLFSAAYSRYLDAGKDAPHLITLDEAFAGVDEQNMRDMFRLVEQMGFNYIMNSQAIWGDYDVVPSLNIYELLRPLNANYVSILGYHWDGNTRSIMTEEQG